jgi:predicted nucleic acid-binding protein
VAVVVDANLLVVMVSGDARGSLVSERVEAWIVAGEPIHAPELLQYELAGAFARLVTGRAISSRQVRSAWDALELLPIVRHPLTDSLSHVVEIALQLQRRSAYDAAYVALAEDLGGVLWTLDGPLARNARDVGLPVRLLEPTSP